MLLGVVLHAMLAFLPGIWPVQDIRQDENLTLIVSAIHGFRMPLFFLLSGFFTAMLWRRRGLKALLAHRFKRIFLPLALGMVSIIPITWLVIGAAKQSAPSPSPTTAGSVDIWTAARTGDITAIQSHVERGGDLNQGDPGFGSTPLSIAALYGHVAAVDLLLQAGADVNARNRDGGTPLHAAAFLGRAEIAGRLLAEGADLQARNQRGETPADALGASWEITRSIAGLLRIRVNREELVSDRTEIAELLAARGDNSATDLADRQAVRGSGSDRAGLILLGLFMFPVFHHLWFLWFLCWLVAGFAAYAFICDKLKWRRTPRRLVASSWRYLWLIPLTMVPQSMMGQIMPVFGPDTSLGLLPIPQVLFYYAIFFGFGVLYHDCDDHEGRLGRGWWLSLPAALGIMFPVGIELTIGGLGFADQIAPQGVRRLVAVFAQVTFAWLMSFGLMGLFRRCFSGERRVLRYVSDSSYWLYLAHLPLLMAIQLGLRSWEAPLLLKLVTGCVGTTALLLLSYQTCVRHTWIGRLLNGPRVQASLSKPPPPLPQTTS